MIIFEAIKSFVYIIPLLAWSMETTSCDHEGTARKIVENNISEAIGKHNKSGNFLRYEIMIRLIMPRTTLMMLK